MSDSRTILKEFFNTFFELCQFPDLPVFFDPRALFGGRDPKLVSKFLSESLPKCYYLLKFDIKEFGVKIQFWFPSKICSQESANFLTDIEGGTKWTRKDYTYFELHIEQEWSTKMIKYYIDEQIVEPKIGCRLNDQISRRIIRLTFVNPVYTRKKREDILPSFIPLVPIQDFLKCMVGEYPNSVGDYYDLYGVWYYNMSPNRATFLKNDDKSPYLIKGLTSLLKDYLNNYLYPRFQELKNLKEENWLLQKIGNLDEYNLVSTTTTFRNFIKLLTKAAESYKIKMTFNLLKDDEEKGLSTTLDWKSNYLILKVSNYLLPFDHISFDFVSNNTQDFKLRTTGFYPKSPLSCLSFYPSLPPLSFECFLNYLDPYDHISSSKRPVFSNLQDSINFIELLNSFIKGKFFAISLKDKESEIEIPSYFTTRKDLKEIVDFYKIYFFGEFFQELQNAIAERVGLKSYNEQNQFNEISQIKQIVEEVETEAFTLSL